MYHPVNWLVFFVLINDSCAILTAFGFGNFSNDKRIRINLNKSDVIDTNHLHTKREGVYPYYSRPHFVSHSSHPDPDYNKLYEIHSEYEDHANNHYPTGPPTHMQHHHEHDKDLAIKALFAPLFGIALLGVVAAMINNPVLLQLGVLSGRRRRKRRNAILSNDSPPIMIPPTVIDRLHNDLMTIGHILSQMPRSNLINEERRLVENYLTCSELGKSLKSNEGCFKRVVCELWSEKSNIKMVTSQRAFIKKLMADLLNNEYMQNDITEKVKDAQKFGKENGYCEIFKCNIINSVS